MGRKHNVENGKVISLDVKYKRLISLVTVTTMIKQSKKQVIIYKTKQKEWQKN